MDHSYQLDTVRFLLDSSTVIMDLRMVEEHGQLKQAPSS